MYSNSHYFDLDNFQPFFIYIEKCRMFENELIQLDPRYIVTKDQEKFIATRDPDYCDLTGDMDIDLIVLCGRNGVGKSTLLQILSNRNFGGEAKFILFWKDHNGNILAHKSVTVVLDGVPLDLNTNMFHIDGFSAMCANGAEQIPANSLAGGIVQAYSANPRIYDEGDKPLFDGFYLDYSSEFFEESHSLGEYYARHLHSDSALVQVPQIIKEHPTLHVLAEIAQDSTFQDFFGSALEGKSWTIERIANLLIDDDSQKLDSEILRLLYLDAPVSSTWQNVHKNDARRLFRISEFETARKEIRELSERVDEWIERKLKQFNLHLEKGRLDELLWFHPFKTYPDSTRGGLSDLSAGEYRRLRMQFLVTPYLFQDQIGWFYFDDTDGPLHPEWSRRFVAELLETFSKAAKQVYQVKRKAKNWSRRMTCILVTHSPFILSDLMPQNILLLSSDGARTHVERGHATFAGNIGQMFHTEFFMETTIGEFARQSIQQAIKALEGPPPREELQRIRKLFSMVGDDVLKNLLLEKLHHAIDRT